LAFFLEGVNSDPSRNSGGTEADFIVGRGQMDTEVNTAFAADLMSDVLAFAKPGALLPTGLTNPQVVIISDILDIAAITLVRGKIPLRKRFA